MTQSKKTESKAKEMTEKGISNFKLGIFPEVKEDQINWLGYPFSVRNNCQVGQWSIGEDNFVGNSLDVAIVGINRYFGNLGKTEKANWLQLWFVAAPNENAIPKNVPCVTYIKSVGIQNFGQEVIRSSTALTDINTAIFAMSFDKQQNDNGVYYTVNFKARERTPEELSQVSQIEHFFRNVQAGIVNLIDSNLPNTMFKYTSNKELEDAKIMLDVWEEQQMPGNSPQLPSIAQPKMITS